MNSGIKSLLIIGICALVFTSVNAQEKPVFEAKQGYLLDISYSIQNPSGDLEKRFGYNSAIGVGGRYKFESGWTLGFQYDWMFGNQVKEVTMFDSILGPTGEIIDQNGQYAVVRLNQRGHTLTLNGGRLFPVLKSNKNSGILVDVGFGFMWHRIDIFASTVTVPQITGDYEKGYDRLCGGLALKQFLGYQHLDPKKRINLQAGFVLQQAFTQSMRSYNYDTREYDDTKRRDLLTGFRIGFSVPIYTKKRSEEEFFID